MIRNHGLIGGLALLAAGCTMLRPEPVPTRPPETHAEPVRPVSAVPDSGTEATGLAIDQSARRAPVSVWERVRIGLTLDGMQHTAVRKEIQSLSARREFLSNTSRRALPYLYFIVEAIEQRGLPMEIALLPIVESGFQPLARSPHGAEGIWQFMPATGRRFGLKQTRWYDGRRDVVAATHAALDYLALLHEHYAGDWLLALAAYNCGTGNVDRAIARNRRNGKATDFWSLDLPRETRRHVPRLLAIGALVKDPDRYGVTFDPIPNIPYFARVDLGGPLDLRKVPAWANISQDEFKTLNPAFKGWYTDPAGPYTILVPDSAHVAVAEIVAALSPEQRITAREYTVRAGDTLSGIADRFTSPVAQIRHANGLRGHLIYPGQRLMIPAPGSGAVLDAPAPSAQDGVHVVRRGDTLWDIARLYDRRVSDIARQNGMLSKATLRPGQQLSIPGYTPPTGTGANGDIYYRVRRGDSLWTISRKFRVSVNDLVAWNKLSRGRHLQPGQRLMVRRAAHSRSPT
jgi:membrane-bound lytic murein transglycosylase D